jgi:hypothetical protein
MTVMTKVRILAVLIAAFSACTAVPIEAAPIFNVQIFGSSDGGATFTNSVVAGSGTTIQFEVVGQLNTTGTSNTQSGTKTLTSEVAGTDGANSLGFDLANSGTGTFSGLALGSGWNGGSGQSAGTVSGSVITGVRPIQAPGVFVGINGSPSVILTGSYTVGTPGTIGALESASGSLKFNNGSGSALVSSTDSTKTDPYIGYSTMTVALAPEPSTLGLLSMGAFAVLLRRRRKTV